MTSSFLITLFLYLLFQKTDKYSPHNKPTYPGIDILNPPMGQLFDCQTIVFTSITIWLILKIDLFPKRKSNISRSFNGHTTYHRHLFLYVMFFVPGTIDTNKSHMQGKGILQGVEHNSALKI